MTEVLAKNTHHVWAAERKKQGCVYGLERRNYISGEVEEREGIVDVSSNWELIPEFGDYHGVIRMER